MPPYIFPHISPSLCLLGPPSPKHFQSEVGMNIFWKRTFCFSSVNYDLKFSRVYATYDAYWMLRSVEPEILVDHKQSISTSVNGMTQLIYISHQFKNIVKLKCKILNTSHVNRRSSTNRHIAKSQKISRKFPLQRGQHIVFDSTRKLFQNKWSKFKVDVCPYHFLVIFPSFLHRFFQISSFRTTSHLAYSRWA